MRLHNRKIVHLFIFILSFLIAILYFREYISAINGWFHNYFLNCGDFWQYAYEAKTFFDTKYIYKILQVGKEPGYFLSVVTVGKIIWTSPSLSMFIVDFLCRFISLFLIWNITIKISNKNLYGIIALLISATIYLFSVTYVQLISRQLFSTYLLLAASFVHFSGKSSKKLFLTSIFLSMSFMAHRFGGILIFFSIFISNLSYYFFNKIINIYNIKVLFFVILFASPYVYLLLSYYLYDGYLSQEMFLGQDFSVEYKWDLGYSYFVNSWTIKDLPILHYFRFQSIYLLLVVSQLSHLKFLKKDYLFINIFFAILFYTFLRVTFSVRSLVSFEIFLIPFIALSLLYVKSRLYKLFIVFSLFALWIFGVSGKSSVLLINKVIPRDSGMQFLTTTLDIEKSILLTSNFCTSEMLSQLMYKTGINLWNDNLVRNYETTQHDDILSYNESLWIMIKNYNSLMLGGPYLHTLFSWDDVYIVLWRYTNVQVLSSIQSWNHPILSAPFSALLYSDPKGKHIKYIFKLDTKLMTFFNNWYYLRDL